jgi:AraC-like DNA-binding protein
MPSSHVFAFADPHPYGATIRAAKVEVLPTAKGNFHAELMHINLHQLWLQRGHESLPRILHGAVDAERSAIEFPIRRDQPAIRYRGIDVSPCEIVVHDSDSVHRRSFGPSYWGAMSLTSAHLAEAARALVGRELTRPSVMRIVRPAPAIMVCLLQLHEDAAQLAKTAPDRLAQPEVARSLEEALVRVMIRCLAEGTVIETGSGERNHMAVISRFEQFLAANWARPIYVSEICAATEVSGRTLRRSCLEHLGMSPVHYLWLRRMHFARLALMRADPGTSTVTDIATDHGFWELGRFSVEYRALFGESPTVTLHRPPDDPRIAQNRPSDLPLSNFA